MPTRRRLLAPVSWVLIAPTARAWSGDSTTWSVVTITAEALRKLILPVAPGGRPRPSRQPSQSD